MNQERVDTLIAFALAAAGEQDFGERELGPIHLLKYVYLADLAFATKHEGATFTEAPWRFHHFGPWAQEVHARIEPVTQALHAQARRFQSNFGNEDWVRWTLVDHRAYERLQNELPVVVVSTVKQSVRKYGHDTTELLHFVYKTRPMLSAAPGERLDFAEVLDAAAVPDAIASAKTLTAKEEKRRREKLRTLRERVQAALKQDAATSCKALRVADPPPRYDDVFDEGSAWLDSLAGEPTESVEGEVRFSDDIWKSPGRGSDDLP